MLATGETEIAQAKQAPALTIARLAVDDFAGCRSGDPDCLKAIHRGLLKDGVPCHLGVGLLLVPATGVPRVRYALRRLKDRYRIELERWARRGGQPPALSQVRGQQGRVGAPALIPASP